MKQSVRAWSRGGLVGIAAVFAACVCFSLPSPAQTAAIQEDD